MAIAETGKKDITGLILELANHVGAGVTPCDIDRAHRVGNVTEENGASEKSLSSSASSKFITKREIIVKFTKSNSL